MSVQIVGRQFTMGNTLYAIGEEVGSGGFGKVYRANAVGGQHAQSLAVKIPAQHVLEDPELLRRFQREARILGNIRHANVVKTYGLLCYEDGTPLLVQEFIEDSVELWERRGQLDSSSLLSIALQVLYALRVTHGTSEDARAIHRDLSPRNILIAGATGVVKVIDFGLAKEDPRVTTILTEAGRALGTPGCIAPEQRADSADVDHRADLFALGKSLAAVLQGRHPEFVDIDLLQEPWRGVLGQLCRYSPSERFESATEVICRLIHDFLNAGQRPRDPSLHLAEFCAWDEVPDEVAWLSRELLLATPADVYAQIRSMGLITDAILNNPHFKASIVFARLDSGAIEAHFRDGTAAFDDCDPIGNMIRRWYTHLEQDVRLIAFQRLCRLAVQYHRYALMHAVRDVFSQESDLAVKRRLGRLLSEEDPGGVVQGRGVIPR